MCSASYQKKNSSIFPVPCQEYFDSGPGGWVGNVADSLDFVNEERKVIWDFEALDKRGGFM